MDKQKYLIREKVYNRLHVIYTVRKGKEIILRGNKRPYPKNGKCELCPALRCGTKASSLVYHHWDDKDISKGMWICRRCHSIVEFVIKNIKIYKKYLKLSYNINEETIKCINV